MKQAKPVFYLKMNRYFRRFMSSRYGGEPLVFPSTSRMFICLEDGLIENPRMLSISKTSRTAAQHDLIVRGRGFVKEVEDEDNDDLFVPVQMPERIMVRGAELYPDNNFQLSKGSASVLRKLIKREFFSALMEYIDERRMLDKMDGRVPNREEAIYGFMRLHGIPVDEFGNINRQVKREFKFIKEELEKRKQEAESRKNNF